VIAVTGALWRGDGQSNPSQVSANLQSICASINDQDEIAYITYIPPNTLPEYLVRNFNGTLTTLAASNASPFLYGGSKTYLPSLANNGSAVFQGGPSTACGNPTGLNGDGVYVGPSGPTVYDPICDSAADISESSVIAGTMNDNLVVAFFAQTKSGTQGIYRGSLTPLVQDGSNGVSLVFARPVINNFGTVAFLATVNGGPASIYTTSDGVAFTRVGQYPNNNGLFAINDSGQVAYTHSSGIYTGTDLVADKVIEPGDPLDGSTFQGGYSYMESLNNTGQVAFFAFLADGRTGVYRADPVNRPPVASNGTVSVTAGASVLGTLSASDPDWDALTYSILSNPTKGTVQITNNGTGAYTYTANAGASGTDTFTFEATDGSLDSNVATVTVTITLPPTCAGDISGLVVVSQGPLKLNRKTGNYTQTVTLKNSDGAIAGPISLVLDGVSSNASLLNASGSTACAAPLGSPYLNIGVGSDGLFSSRERATVTLEFTNPSGQPITYDFRVLAGSGNR
jgi:hypothetical protein